MLCDSRTEQSEGCADQARCGENDTDDLCRKSEPVQIDVVKRYHRTIAVTQAIASDDKSE